MKITFQPKPLVLPRPNRFGNKFQLRRAVSPIRSLIGQIGVVLALFLIVITAMLLFGFILALAGLVVMDSFPA